MKKLLTLSALLLASANLSAQAKPLDLAETSKNLKVAALGLAQKQSELEKALNDMIASIEANSQAFEGGINAYTGILDALAMDNKNNGDVLKQINAVKSQLNLMKGNINDLKGLAPTFKAVLAPTNTAQSTISNLTSAFIGIDSSVVNIENQTPPYLCKNYKGAIVTGWIQTGNVRNTWNLVDKNGKYYLISPNVGLIGKGTEYVVSRTVKGWIDSGMLGSDGKTIVCMNAPTPPLPPKK
ncbi:hypothetical protein Bealeia1_01224 [Candidatus Bealeia paramacronuclearis]|uniref:DUF3450 family protein n=1 Tax=Candidatus Bealeia paramacronuclearis TaxID=1921001 RepID=A0ABZ2C3W1_9PROT|nr:hypothetical protein [Candidatus Bealeia paramacronuclearis]